MFAGDIEKLTRENTYYRRVINTNPAQQLVLMSLSQGETIPREKHLKTSQFIRVEQGKGWACFETEGKTRKTRLRPNVAVIVPPGVMHKIVQTADESLKLYTVYSPPVHDPKKKQRRQNE